VAIGTVCAYPAHAAALRRPSWNGYPDEHGVLRTHLKMLLVQAEPTAVNIRFNAIYLLP
jgi:hypothetical protein